MSANEVVIVGGGPAGMSAAIFLAHHRPALADRIVVLEKERYPRDKCCAGGLGERADRALAAVGVRVDVPSVPVNGVSAAFQVGEIALREGSIGRVVRRVEFDRALALAARARGVRIVEGARVTAASASPRGALVESSAGTFAGRVVVGADGVGSVVRRALGLPFGRLRAQAVEVDTEPVAGDRARDLLHFEMRDRSFPGYLWDFPTVVDGRELVCRGAYVLHEGALGAGRGAGPAPDAERVLRGRLAALGLDPDRYRRKRFAERGLDRTAAIARPAALLVGEAAGIDPMLGEGIAQAIAYGALAGEYLAEKLEAGDLRFDDWGRRVERSLLGLDIRFRRRVMRAFYGAPRERVERYLLDEPSFLRFGMRHFAGRAQPAPDALRAAATGALVVGRIGIERLLGSLPPRAAAHL
ncbi:NAD(P)/FAD-dependent oxidoreductase [Sorangium sp. So ce1389]|uniref:NAD(P)/FAD-dependent oxidoreductase n=1 Tax=Sorangium sp. So ce1389 TaxID=3133336 RepID=UPI003F5EDDFE